MSIIIEIIEKLPELLPLKPANEATVSKAENDLKLKFADEYKEYLLKFGAILADGVELTGIAKSEHRDVVKVTKQAWELNSSVSKNLYVIEDTRVDGIIIWQNSEGKIYKSSPNSDAKKIYDSLSDYLKSKL